MGLQDGVFNEWDGRLEWLDGSPPNAFAEQQLAGEVMLPDRPSCVVLMRDSSWRIVDCAEPYGFICTRQSESK